MKKNKRASRSTPAAPIPLGCKSYLQDWLKRTGAVHSKADIRLRTEVDGWRSLTATMLAEVVCAAAQTEDALLSQEAQEWLQSPAAEMMFEECNLDYRTLSPWLKAGCPLPQEMNGPSQKSRASQDYLGIAFGRLTLEGYDPFFPEDIYDILNQACDHF